LLINEDYYVHIEGREIISNLSKAAGLAHMILTMRPDIDHVDEYVHNTMATTQVKAQAARTFGRYEIYNWLANTC